MFVREVAASRDSVYEVKEDEDSPFRDLLRIVDKFVKFVKPGSLYVIDSSARAKVMRYGEKARFKELESYRFRLSVYLHNR